MILAAALAGVTVLIAAGLAWTVRLVHIGNLDAHDLAAKLAVPAPVSALDWPELHLNAVVAQPDEQPMVLLHVDWPAYPQRAATRPAPAKAGPGSSLPAPTTSPSTTWHRIGAEPGCPVCGKDGGMLDHLSIQCADVGASAAFYDAVLAPLAGTRVMDFGEVIGFGIAGKPEFWIGPHTTGEGFRESHIAFASPDRAAVRAFFQAAVDIGAEILHEPRLWPEYHASYYGAFVRDPDGNNVEAVCHAPG